MGGSSILKQYNGSPSKLLAVVYPQYEWLPWKFDTCPRNFWGNVENQLKFMQWAGKELLIKEMSDWYRVSYQVYKCICAEIYLKRIFLNWEVNDC